MCGPGSHTQGHLGPGVNYLWNSGSTTTFVRVASNAVVLSRVALTKRRRSLRKERNSFKYDTIEEERGTGSSQQSSSPSKSKSGSDDALADGAAHPHH